MGLTLQQQEIVEAYGRNVAADIIPHGAIVVGGAAMVMLGIKPSTPDLDVVVPWAAYAQLERHRQDASPMYDQVIGLRFDGRGPSHLSPYGLKYGSRGPVDVLLAPDSEQYAVPFDELRRDTIQIAGMDVLAPDALLSWKSALNREKDARDARLIANWLWRRLTGSIPMGVRSRS